MFGLPRGIKQRGLDVLRLKEGIVAENFLMRRTGSEKLEQIHHSKTRAADAGASATFAGFDGDAFERFHAAILLRGDGFASSVCIRFTRAAKPTEMRANFERGFGLAPHPFHAVTICEEHPAAAP